MIDTLKGALERGLGKLFGTKSQRDVKRLRPLALEVFEQAETYQSLTDEQLQAKTQEFREAIAGGKTEEDILVEAFAVVKEACRRNKGRSWLVVGQKIVWDMDPFLVQAMGGIALHEGKIAEMATGEGKTLVALFPLYLNALSGKGAHLVTVNDYLARRDSEWVGEMLVWLGLTVGCIQHGMTNEQRREAYGCDVTYGTNNEFGFDYLRDNMVLRGEEKVQRPHNFAIVDEVDSVLIDEARTPLIISGPVAHAKQYYEELRGPVENLIRQQGTLIGRFLDEAEAGLKSSNKDEQYEGMIRLVQVQRGAPRNKRFIKLLSEEEMLKKRMLSVEGDFMREKRAHVLDEDLLFSIDEKGHAVAVSDQGRQILAPDRPEAFVLPDLSESIGKIDADASLGKEERLARKEELHRAYAERSDVLGNVQQLLKAYAIYERDKEYVVQEGKVMIVDEFTGRLMPGRRFSDGLHQALEAKERVRIGEENQTLATITIQNYFRMYRKLSGMTGTAETEAGEFWEIYKLDVVVIPTNIPVQRADLNDVVYRTKREKYSAILDEIQEMHQAGRPVLVGTISVEVSETLARMLKRRGINHNVLNAKFHQQEAEIVANAGQRGAVTIATNMAGRGTDIKLGEGVVSGETLRLEDGRLDKRGLSGGLHIIGTERHESRRIDRQLRGRSGRQGDPGSTLFFLSLEDDLMRLFAPERIANMMDKLGAEEGEVITHSFLTRAIEQAQKRVEGHNFAIRKHLLEYDDVMNQQRDVIYTLRNAALEKADLQGRVQEMVAEQVQGVLDRHVSASAHPDHWDLPGLLEELQLLILAPVAVDPKSAHSISYPDLQERCLEAAVKAYGERQELFGSEQMREVERWILLRVIDEKWRDHLYEIDQLRAGIGLRAYGQKDPLLEYKREAFDMFEELMGDVDADTVRYMFRVMPARAPQAAPPVGGSAPGAGAGAGPAGSGPNRGTGNQPPAAVAGRRVAPPAEAVMVGGAPPARSFPSAVQENKAGAGSFGGGPQTSAAPQAAVAQQTFVRDQPKVGRNDACPCGSGKKYKKCHGAAA